jgi:asparagine synthase (glutamine-hydrolysing)
MYLGFHRLNIMDKSTSGDQPFIIEHNDRTIYCLCNGEIYEYLDIIKEYGLNVQSKSDCEVIPLLYKQLCFTGDIEGDRTGFRELVSKIKGGEFACAIIDIDHTQSVTTIRLVTDPASVRPLFYAITDKEIVFSSVLKGLIDIVDGEYIRRFKPGHILEIKLWEENNMIKSATHEENYYIHDKTPIYQPISDEHILTSQYLQKALIEVKSVFEKSVISSLIVACCAKILNEKYGRILKTFSIGLPGSSDGPYAKMVAKHCGTFHTHIKLTSDDFLKAIEEVIWATETCDVTTIRASTGQFLISRWIRKHTDVKVLLIGDGSDELCSGYMYFHNNPSATDSHNENCRLIKDIHKYDGLRADRGVSGNGLEARMPFLKHTFIDLILSIDPRVRIPIDGIEKWLLRKSFEGTDYIPEEVLWRKKEAFSDGVSSTENSWYDIIQKRVKHLYTDKDLKSAQTKYPYCPPTSMEGLYYREIFVRKFGDDKAHLIPYQWLPKWCGNITEPSARVLDVYNIKRTVVICDGE